MTDVSDFSPETGHLPACTYNRYTSTGDCDLDCAKQLLDLLPEVDRNARAYGYEVGKTGDLIESVENSSPENPFLDPNWRERLVL